MTTMTNPTPTPPPPPAPPTVRRSETNRVLAGVCGGLGEYFGVDPVLFRVLFGVSAFFGGFGIIAYLVAWAVIPEASVPSAPVDRAMSNLRRRQIPVWAVILLGAAIVWGALFSWWSSPWFPWRFPWPVLLVAVVLALVFGRRRPSRPQPGAFQPPASEVPTLGADQPTAAMPPTTSPFAKAEPDPVTQAQYAAWVAERQQARRERTARLRPMRVIAWSTVLVTIAALAVADALTGIPLPVYFWVTAGLVLMFVIVGAAIRRPVWEMTPLLVPAILGLIAFGGTRVSLHDGSGDRFVSPTSSSQLPSDYRMAFGRTTFDLRQLPATTDATAHIREAAGEVRVIVPPSADVIVHSHLRYGAVRVDESVVESGVNVTRDVVTGSGGGLTLNVDVEAGTIHVVHES